MTRQFVLGLILLCLAATASAQQTMSLGDLLDHGGKRLEQAEVTQLVSGATMSGTQGGRFPNVTFKNLFAADGSVSGDAWDKGKWFTKITGKWSVNDAAQLCSDLMNDQKDKIGACVHYYRLGTAYYAVRGVARSDVAIERTFTR